MHTQETCQKQECEHEFGKALQELLTAWPIVPHTIASSLELLLEQERTETATEMRMLTGRGEQGKRQERKCLKLRTRGEEGGEVTCVIANVSVTITRELEK